MYGREQFGSPGFEQGAPEQESVEAMIAFVMQGSVENGKKIKTKKNKNGNG